MEKIFQTAQQLTQKLRHQNPGGEFQVKCGAPVIAALFEEAVNVEVEERGEAPDLVGIGRQVAQHAAEHAYCRPAGA